MPQGNGTQSNVRESLRRFTAQGWVWSSGLNQTGADQISIIAIAETVGALAFYWWFATSSNTYWLLLLSAFIAFFVLLRSPSSVRLGRETFLNYLESSSPSKQLTLLWITFGILMGGLAVYLLSNRGYFSNVEINIAVKIPAKLLVFGNVFVATVVFCSGALAKTGGLATAITQLLGRRAPDGKSASPDVRGTNLSKLIRAIGLMLLGLGFASGIFMRAIAIRCFATARYIVLGLLCFPSNWLRMTLSEDVLTPPTLVPGLPRKHFLHPSSFLRWKDMEVDELVFSLVFLPIIVVPAWVYRLSLKSTAWLYFPVVWIVYIPRKLRDEAGRLVWVGYAGRTFLDWVVLASALLVLAFSGATAIDPEAYSAAKSATDGQPWTPAHLLFAFDLSKLHIWHALTIPSAALTLLLFLWADLIRKRLSAGEVLLTESWEIRVLLVINQTKNFLTIGWIFITFMSFARTAWILGYLPEWLSKFFQVIEPISKVWSAA